MKLDISIIIVNYRGWQSLNKCLHSISEINNNQFTFEVIIVDNFSNDNKFEQFKNKFSQFKFVLNSGNNGFSNGCNLGAKTATGEYLFFLNPDTKITQKAIFVLLDTAKKNRDYAILACQQINEKGKIYNHNKLFPSFFRLFGFTRAIYKKLNNKYLTQKFDSSKNILFPDWVTGAVIFISRKWLDKVNGWNEDYWLYFEDVDLCKKIANKGGKIVLLKQPNIFHEHGGASRINIQTKALTKAHVILSKHIYINTHFSGFIKYVSLFLVITVTLIEKMVLFLLGCVLFFIPKLKVNIYLFKHIVKYYYNSVIHCTLVSEKSMNSKF